MENKIIKDRYTVKCDSWVELIYCKEGKFSNGISNFNHIKLNGKLITDPDEVWKNL